MCITIATDHCRIVGGTSHMKLGHISVINGETHGNEDSAADVGVPDSRQDVSIGNANSGLNGLIECLVTLISLRSGFTQPMQPPTCFRHPSSLSSLQGCRDLAPASPPSRPR